MPDLPAISIAITLYNKSDFIVEAIETALAQTVQDFEIVVVDDGSTDDGPTKVRLFDDRRINLQSQPNAGVSIARTRAMHEARGKYVAFLDADDIWRPDHLLHLVGLTRRFPDATLFGNNYVEGSTEPRSTEFVRDVQYHIVDDYFLECAAGRSPFYTSSCMVPRERALALGGFPAGKVCGEDLALWVRLATDGSVAVSNYIGCIYRRGIDSLSWQASYRNAPDVSMAALKELLERHDEWPDRRRQSAREYLFRLALAHGLDALRAGEVDQARSYLRVASDTRLLRSRLWQARLLAFAPKSIRETLFKIDDFARGA